MRRFSDNPRIVLWDLYNKPGKISIGKYAKKEAEYKTIHVMELLTKSFTWARERGTSRPITSEVWQGDLSSIGTMHDFNRFMVLNSDVIPFHCYEPPKNSPRAPPASKFSESRSCAPST